MLSTFQSVNFCVHLCMHVYTFVCMAETQQEESSCSCEHVDLRVHVCMYVCMYVCAKHVSNILCAKIVARLSALRSLYIYVYIYTHEYMPTCEVVHCEWTPYVYTVFSRCTHLHIYMCMCIYAQVLFEEAKEKWKPVGLHELVLPDQVCIQREIIFFITLKNKVCHL